MSDTTQEYVLNCRKYVGQKGQIERASYSRDSLGLSNTKTDTDFLSREMAVLVNYIVMQMDKSVHACLDIDAFMNSLSSEQDGHGFETTK